MVRRRSGAAQGPAVWLAVIVLVLAPVGFVSAEGGSTAAATGNAAQAGDPVLGALAAEKPGEERGRVFDALVDLFRDYYWKSDHLDWDAWGARHREAALAAEQRVVFDAVMRRMVAEVGDDHSRWLGLESIEFDSLVGQAGPKPTFGLQVRFLPGAGLVIERVLPTTPADLAGMQRGDVIEAIDGVDLKNADQSAVDAAMSASIAAGVARLAVRRGARLLSTIELRPVLADEHALVLNPYAAMLEGDIGFLYLPSFTLVGTGAKAHELLTSLRDRGARSYVIDLRGNLGGSLAELGVFLGAFIDGSWAEAEARGRVLWHADFQRTSDAGVARLIGSDGRTVREARIAGPTLIEAPLAVLIDSRTSSAAEVAAAVLQARGLAVVVGVATLGNVEVVQGFALPDGSNVLVAVANLRLPGGGSLDAGVQPDERARADVRQLARGFDPVIAGAQSALTGLPFTPGRWF